MSILLFALKLLGWILLGLLALLLLLLLLPVTAMAKYDAGGFELWLSVLGLRFHAVDPAREKKAKEKKKPQGEEKEAGGEKEKKKARAKPQIDWELVKALLAPGGRAVKLVFGSLRWRHIRLRLVVGGADPCDVGIRTGRTWAALGALLSLALGLWKHMSFDELTVLPDFLDDKADEALYAAWLTVQPIVFLAAACIVLWRIVCYKIHSAREEVPQTKEKTEYERTTA